MKLFLKSPQRRKGIWSCFAENSVFAESESVGQKSSLFLLLLLLLPVFRESGELKGFCWRTQFLTDRLASLSVSLCECVYKTDRACVSCSTRLPTHMARL